MLTSDDFIHFGNKGQQARKSSIDSLFNYRRHVFLSSAFFVKWQHYNITLLRLHKKFQLSWYAPLEIKFYNIFNPKWHLDVRNSFKEKGKYFKEKGEFLRKEAFKENYELHILNNQSITTVPNQKDENFAVSWPILIPFVILRFHILKQSVNKVFLY